MHAADLVLLSALRHMSTKAKVEFQPNPISSFREKVEQTDKQTNIAYYNIDFASVMIWFLRLCTVVLY